MTVQIILSCRAARPDPENSHHTVTKSQIIRNSTNNNQISFSCRLWIPSIFYPKQYIFMILHIIWYSARNLKTRSILYRDFLIKSITYRSSESFDICEICPDCAFSVINVETRSILYGISYIIDHESQFRKFRLVCDFPISCVFC
jgi:hypothetical protein